MGVALDREAEKHFRSGDSPKWTAISLRRRRRRNHCETMQNYSKTYFMPKCRRLSNKTTIYFSINRNHLVESGAMFIDF